MPCCTWISKYLLGKIQDIQNSAARIVTRSKHSNHITPILIELHWLPVEKRIDYKILLTTFKARHDLGPRYIQDLITPYLPSRSLRSLDLFLIRRPRSRTKTFGDRSLVVYAPHLWNGLPHHIHQIDELENFKCLYLVFCTVLWAL